MRVTWVGETRAERWPLSLGPTSTTAPRCLLRLFDGAAGGLADWSELDAEAERLSNSARNCGDVFELSSRLNRERRLPVKPGEQGIEVGAREPPLEGFGDLLVGQPTGGQQHDLAPYYVAVRDRLASGQHFGPGRARSSLVSSIR